MTSGRERRAGQGLAFSAGALLLVAAVVGGCRRHGEVARRPAPTAVRARLLVLTPAAEDRALPRAGEPTVSPAGPSPASVEATPALATAGAPQGVIPVPTSRPSQAVAAAGPPRQDPAIAALVDQVSVGRLQAALVELGTTKRPAGGGATAGTAVAEPLARWLERSWRELDGSYGNQVLVELEGAAADGRGGATRSVLATLPGIGRSKRILYLTAGLADEQGAAAGAPAAPTQDVGEAAMLAEVARVLVQRRWDATIRLAAFLGNDDGEASSAQHAEAAAGIGLPIAAVLDFRLLPRGAGVSGGDGPAAFGLQPGDPREGPSWQLARGILALGPTYERTKPILAATEDGVAGGGLAFSQAGYGAVRLLAGVPMGTVSASTAGSGAAVDAGALAAGTRTLVGLVANLALAPVVPAYAPVVELAADAPGRVHARWDPVADPAVAGYWVGWRRGDEPTYERLAWLGRETRWFVEPQPPGTTVFMAIATSDDQGHAGPFGPEARWSFK